MITKDKVFIITGASAGIGSELAYQLAEKGAHVVCAARTMTKLETVCKNIANKNGSAIPIQADITNRDQCEKIIDPSRRNLRLLRDILINHINIVMKYKQDNGDDAARKKNINAPLCNYLGEICLKRDTANERIVIVSNIDNDPNNYLTSYLELDN